MGILTIILFFVYTFCLGYSVSFFNKEKDIFEAFFMRIGIGLGVLIFLLLFLNMLGIPLDWRIILLISLVIPFYKVSKQFKKIKYTKFKITKSRLYFGVILIIFGLTIFMYLKGAFAYPYFEDDDPWAHATGIKYMAVEKELDDPNNNFKYIEAYPPGYDGLMGLLHQTTKSLMWTMKFFNSLIISLGIIFFYFFVLYFRNSRNTALIATLILAMVPSYLSHFIWAHSLVATLFIVSLYCLTKLRNNRKYFLPTVLVISSICLTQPTQPMKFFIIYLIYFVVDWATNSKFNIKLLSAIFLGYLSSIIWWGWNFSTMFAQRIEHQGIGTGDSFGFSFASIFSKLQRMFPPDSGTATRPYTFNDFFIAKSQNMINNPVGIGIVISILGVIGILFVILSYKSLVKEKKASSWILILCILFTFLGVNSMTFNLPFGLLAFRFWMLFAIFFSIAAAEGFWVTVQILKKFGAPKIATSILLIILMFNTSGIQKYAVNTATWPPGAMWTSFDEVIGYTWLKNLPADTKVFAYSSDEQVIGFDMYSCLWCDNIIEFRSDLFNKNASELYSFLSSNDYEYLIFDAMGFRNFARVYGENQTNTVLSKRIDEIVAFGKFTPAHQGNGILIFKIN